MLKIVKADKDTYITDKVVMGKRQTDGNVGLAGTLDLFKLYGTSFSGSNPNTEKSRILIHFDLEGVKKLVQDGKLDPGDPSFFCKIHMRDVYGGQPTPKNFSVSVYPLSASFDEGVGKDVSYYSDKDASNWLSSSANIPWMTEGCGQSCSAQLTTGDYITSSISLASTLSTQEFLSGTEDLIVDVTNVVSATLSGELPDRGFRISFEDSLESDEKTYFVKRFAASNAYDESKRPKLLVGFDDSIADDTQNLTFDTPCDLVLYNYSSGDLSDIVSGSSLTSILGDNCIKLKLVTEVSGGNYDLVFDGSQYSFGSNYATGIYYSTVTLLSSDPVLSLKLSQSGSIKFTPVWVSNDMSVSYVSGSTLTARPQSRTSSRSIKNYVVNVNNVMTEYTTNDEAVFRVTIFDQSSPLIKVVKVPVELPGVVLNNVYYQVRDAVTGEILMPFDDTKNSTKVSSDSEGMFFKLDMSSFLSGRTYVVDVMIKNNGMTNKYPSCSPVFRVYDTET